MTHSGGRVRPALPGDPALIGPYRIVGRLGTGGMGVVHAGLGTDGRRVAVKVIHAAHAQDPEFRARFRREVQLSARVHGPCLVPLLAADPDAAEPWLATPYAPGPTLNEHLAASGPLTGGSLYAFASGTAQALAAIHRAGVVHRDMKPQNVILGPGGPCVLDFGIAHAQGGTSVTRTGVMTGTPGWISPEHYRMGTAGPAGDVFAWGALVAYAATGRLPFGTGAPDVVAFRVLSAAPDLTGLPVELRVVVDRALAKDPDERLSGAGAAEACSLLLASQSTRSLGATVEPTLVDGLVGVEWEVPTPEDPDWPAPPARPRASTIGVVIGAAVVAGSLVGGVLALRPSDGTDASAKNPVAAPVRAPGTAGPTGPKGGAGAPTVTPELVGDPRRAAVPVDPLAGVTNTAYTRSEDGVAPTTAEWQASTTAPGPEERKAAEAMRKHVGLILGTKDMDFMEPVVTFNERAQTVMITGGPVSTLSDLHKAQFARAGRMAACAALARHLESAPTAWPYGRFAVAWKGDEQTRQPDLLDFGQATDGCFNQTAGSWEGGWEGITAARMPSTAKDEVTVADRVVKKVQDTWDQSSSIAAGLPSLDLRNDIQLGFDPVEHAAYVWVWDTHRTIASRVDRARFRAHVRETVCPELLARYRAGPWPYDRVSVGLYQGDGGPPEFIGSDTCTP